MDLIREYSYLSDIFIRVVGHGWLCHEVMSLADEQIDRVSE